MKSREGILSVHPRLVPPLESNKNFHVDIEIKSRRIMRFNKILYFIVNNSSYFGCFLLYVSTRILTFSSNLARKLLKVD